MLYRSKPSEVEAVQWTGDLDEVEDFAPGKVAIDSDDGELLLYTGKNGAQKWVPVPVDHWLVHPPEDLTDIWPVDDVYFRAKYEAVE